MADVTFSKIPNGQPIGLCKGWHPLGNRMQCVKAGEHAASDGSVGPFCMFHVKAYQANAQYLIAHPPVETEEKNEEPKTNEQPATDTSTT